MRQQTGFTLVEVLAALLIFSVSIAGLSQVGFESSRTVAALEDKVLAAVVADSQLVLARQRPLNQGARTGEMEQMGRTYRYRLETKPTDVSNFYELTVTVQGLGDDQVLLRRVAYRRGNA